MTDYFDYFDYPSHGDCWLWNKYLIFIHASSDLLTFLAYMIIPLIVLHVYYHGHLRLIEQAFPKLWRLGAGFVFFCGLSHLGSFLEVYIGGSIYWITGANKLIMATVSMLFVIEFWRQRSNLVLIGKILEAVNRVEDEKEKGMTLNKG